MRVRDDRGGELADQGVPADADDERGVLSDGRERVAPPPGFDADFLEWFRRETEAAWDRCRPRTFEEYVVGAAGGHEWQTGTRWTCDLTERDVDEIERRWGLVFPADYRLFLRTLHATDRPRAGALYASSGQLVPSVAPGVYHWLHEESEIRAALEGFVHGLLFDVEYGRVWLREWGERPTDPAERERVIRARVAAAPKLAPILMHRALVLEPARPGNPVLSIHQSDVIVYGGDLRSYLLAEFASLLPPLLPETPSTTDEERSVPLWLDLESRWDGGRTFGEP